MNTKQVHHLFFVAVSLLLAGTVRAGPRQDVPIDNRPKNASISGCVTINHAAAAGLQVALSESTTAGLAVQQSNARTDREGCYRFSGLAAGEYDLSVYAQAYTFPQANRLGRPGKTVMISDSEQLEGIDFRLVRGGVITGRVTSIGAKPVIAEHVTLYKLDEKRAAVSVVLLPSSMFETDDRGIYRIFGLPEGRYLLSVGDSPEAGARLSGASRPFYPRTFHPNVQKEADAGIIEVSLGAETTNVDITLGDPLKTYEASGRIVDAETGVPVPSVEYAFSAFEPDKGPVGTTFWDGKRSDTQGSFRINSLTPGKYVILTRVPGNAAYSEPTLIGVTGDISGLEIKVFRSATVSGTVVYEGPPSPDTAERLQGLEIAIGVKTENSSMPPQSFRAKIEPGGSFRIPGVRSGSATFGITQRGSRKHLSITAVERRGVLLDGPFQIASGEHIDGIKLVLTTSDGAVKGHVNVEGGELPAGTRMLVFVRKIGNKASGDGGLSEVDSKGNFLIESLSSGEYELILTSLPSGGPLPFAPVKQIIDVPPTGVTEVKLALNLGSKKESNDR